VWECVFGWGVGALYGEEGGHGEWLFVVMDRNLKLDPDK
jgi:hypothetical protein